MNTTLRGLNTLIAAERAPEPQFDLASTCSSCSCESGAASRRRPHRITESVARGRVGRGGVDPTRAHAAVIVAQVVIHVGIRFSGTCSQSVMTMCLAGSSRMRRVCVRISSMTSNGSFVRRKCFQV